MLKGRFPSLKDLSPERDIRDTYRVVEALVALHNLCIDLGDHPERIPFFDGEDPTRDDEDDPVNDIDATGYGGIMEGDGAELPACETDEWLREAGRRRRLAILNDLFPL